MHPSITLHKAKQSSVFRGHPWIFPKAIDHFSGNLQTGQLVDVFSAEGDAIGVGVYNEHSLYRVRLLTLGFEKADSGNLAAILNQRLNQALLLRQALNLPNPQTTAYRLFNSEADGLSGITIDCFGSYCVVASSAFWVELHKDLISDCLNALMPNKTIVWLSQTKPLIQDGWKGDPIQVEPTRIEVLEAGARFQIDFATAQKTGLFIDQRENHQRIASLAKGKRVLDLYTYTGGFAIHAALAGATKVTAVDSSKQAIEQAKRNAELNNIDSIDFIAADARDYLTQAQDYDLIILDPPKLVPSKRDLNKAKNYYRFLHREVFKVMKPQALLMTCNCSSALSSFDFINLVSHQAQLENRLARLLGVYGPASCHPTLPAFPEGNYLTAVLMGIV